MMSTSHGIIAKMKVIRAPRLSDKTDPDSRNAFAMGANAPVLVIEGFALKSI